jgi:hypothetical protein
MEKGPAAADIWFIQKSIVSFLMNNNKKDRKINFKNR